MVVVLAEAGGDTIIEDHAIFAEHQPVAAAADGELGPCIGVDAVEEFR